MVVSENKNSNPLDLKEIKEFKYFGSEIIHDG